MLEAKVTNRKAIRARKYPDGYEREILQELSLDFSQCWSLKRRPTWDALKRVIVRLIPEFIARHYQDGFS